MAIDKINTKSGFTLIEVLMYLAIFSIIIGAIVSLATVVSLQRVQNEVISDVNYQGEAVMSLLTQTVHAAATITSPGLGANSGTLTLAMNTNSVNPTAFSVVNDGTTNRLQISEGNPATLNYLTNSHITVSGLSFSNVGVTGSRGSVLIQFTMSYRTSSNNSAFIYSKTFNGAAGVQ